MSQGPRKRALTPTWTADPASARKREKGQREGIEAAKTFLGGTLRKATRVHCEGTSLILDANIAPKSHQINALLAVAANATVALDANIAPEEQ
jgi:hypothetical protein